MDGSFRRDAVKRRLVEVGEQTVGTGVDLGIEGRDNELVGVSYDWLGDVEGDTALYFGEINGAATPESIGKDALTDDTFTIGFRITVWGFPSVETADQAAMRVLNGFAAPLRTLQRLIGAAAPDTAMPPTGPVSPFDVASCFVASFDGPYHSFPESDGDDYAGAIDGVIQCRSNVK